jgi:hypothetical protein
MEASPEVSTSSEINVKYLLISCGEPVDNYQAE